MESNFEKLHKGEFYLEPVKTSRTNPEQMFYQPLCCYGDLHCSQLTKYSPACTIQIQYHNQRRLKEVQYSRALRARWMWQWPGKSLLLEETLNRSRIHRVVICLWLRYFQCSITYLLLLGNLLSSPFSRYQHSNSISISNQLIACHLCCVSLRETPITVYFSCLGNSITSPSPLLPLQRRHTPSSRVILLLHGRFAPLDYSSHFSLQAFLLHVQESGSRCF